MTKGKSATTTSETADPGAPALDAGEATAPATVEVAPGVEVPAEVHPVREPVVGEGDPGDEDDGDEAATMEPSKLGTGGLLKPPGKRAIAAQEKRRAERPPREDDVKPVLYLVQITERVSPKAAPRVVLHDADGYPHAFTRRGEKPVTARRVRLAPVMARQLSVEGWEVVALPKSSAA